MTLGTDSFRFNLSDDLPPAQRDAARLLASTLTHDDLTRLVESKLINAFRHLSRHILNRTASLGKESLAAALLIRHGTELFSDKEVRKSYARRAKINYPERWTPGKAAALRFAREAGFNEVFAGTPASAPPDDVEWLEGRTAVPPLADFQLEVLEDCEAHLWGPRKFPRVVVTLPTGGGKTRVASEYIKRYVQRCDAANPRCILWLAHTEELLEQAIEAFRQAWRDAANVPPIRIDRRFAQFGRGDPSAEDYFTATHAHFQIAVYTPQRFLNDLKRLTGTHAELIGPWMDSIGLIIIDEAHRAAAPQYRRVLQHFDHERGPQVLGLTATPFRQEYLNDPDIGTKALLLLFRRMVEPHRTLGENPRVKLQERGVLAMPIERRINTESTLSLGCPLSQISEAYDAETLESFDRKLMALADEATRRAFVFGHLLPICRNPNNRVLYFGPSVDDAEIVAFMLRTLGIASGFVSGKSRAAQRRNEISAFRRGEISVLCNCEVLTTGFDAPQVSHVVIARPTVSHVLFEQMVGRGLRGKLFGGTETCEVIYFVDHLDADSPRLGYRGWRRIWGLEDDAASVDPEQEQSRLVLDDGVKAKQGVLTVTQANARHTTPSHTSQL